MFLPLGYQKYLICTNTGKEKNAIVEMVNIRSTQIQGEIRYSPVHN